MSEYWQCMHAEHGVYCSHPECQPYQGEAWRAMVATEHRETERKQLVRCEHCGTEGIYTYGGVIGPWSKDDGKQLTELTDTLRWDGTREFGCTHDLPRCFEKIRSQLQETRNRLEGAEKALGAVAIQVCMQSSGYAQKSHQAILDYFAKFGGK